MIYFVTFSFLPGQCFLQTSFASNLWYFIVCLHCSSLSVEILSINDSPHKYFIFCSNLLLFMTSQLSNPYVWWYATEVILAKGRVYSSMEWNVLLHRSDVESREKYSSNAFWRRKTVAKQDRVDCYFVNKWLCLCRCLCEAQRWLFLPRAAQGSMSHPCPFRGEEGTLSECTGWRDVFLLHA